jgi:SAM-dependent methyltransferase
MPFHDGTFDAIWTVWVLEHVQNPESALREMRRVVRPGGLILLKPAWFCTSWAAQGYAARPYSDFDLRGKLVKASVPVRNSPVFNASYILPVRALRYAAYRIGGESTPFHYRRLTPNYERYWVPDGDAVNSMDPYEAVLWFESRGDRCLNCCSTYQHLSGLPRELVIRVGPTAGERRTGL